MTKRPVIDKIEIEERKYADSSANYIVFVTVLLSLLWFSYRRRYGVIKSYHRGADKITLGTGCELDSRRMVFSSKGSAIYYLNQAINNYLKEFDKKQLVSVKTYNVDPIS